MMHRFEDALPMLLTAGALVLGGCVVEETGRDEPQDERFLDSPCFKYYSPAAACGFVAVVGGAIPAACTGGGALPWALGAFDACLGYYEIADIGEFAAMARECGLSMIQEPIDDGPITGHEAGCTFDDCDPTTECIGIIGNRTYEDCYTVQMGPNPPSYQCVTRICGDQWGAACETATERCIQRTTDLWLEDNLELIFGDDPPAEAADSASCTPSFDLDHDGQTDADDVRALTSLAMAAPPLADLDADGLWSDADRDFLVHQVLQIPYGDADQDGDFDSSDLQEVFSAGLYETNQLAQWDQGDWDGDGLFTSGDLVLALADGCYEQGPGCI
ncbi:MAG: hypothetical protein AB1Z98_22120 [Nannocystaceae bacterium]